MDLYISISCLLVSSHNAHYQEREKQKLVSNSDLENFFQSEASVTAVKLLSCTQWETVKLRDVNLVRNYLITKLIIKNDMRPCALYQLPLKAFSSLEKDSETLLFEVPLFYDKTANSQGCASYLHMSGNY